MGHWWHHDIVAAGKLPLLLAFSAFVVTFAVTRFITRMIRAGRGPFRNVSAGGVHLHHSTPGIILMTVGAYLSIGAPPHEPWRSMAAVLIGIGTSLVMDEFAMILHLSDVYWSNEGRFSVEMVSLTVACLGFVLAGASPLGISGIGTVELSARLTLIGFYVVTGICVLISLLKGKYRTALFGVFVPLVALTGALRLGRPTSIWAERFYGPRRVERATKRHDAFDRRWDPVWLRFSNLIGGAPSLPDPAARPAVLTHPSSAGPGTATGQ